jgi:hypothetical protein
MFSGGHADVKKEAGLWPAPQQYDHFMSLKRLIKFIFCDLQGREKQR